MSTVTGEAADPYVLSPEEEDDLLQGAPWRRFAVLGDSVAEGLGERIEGYAEVGWAPRVAAALERRQPELAHVNLGRRELRAAAVRETQLEPALEFEPDLAGVICGGNDLLASRFDGDAVEAEIDGIVAALRDAGADVFVFTLFDITRALDMPPEFGSALANRLHELFDRTRALAQRRGAIVVEAARHPAAADPGIYSSDFRHANTRGHAIAASLTVEALGRYLRRGE